MEKVYFVEFAGDDRGALDVFLTREEAEDCIASLLAVDSRGKLVVREAETCQRA